MFLGSWRLVVCSLLTELDERLVHLDTFEVTGESLLAGYREKARQAPQCVEWPEALTLKFVTVE